MWKVRGEILRMEDEEIKSNRGVSLRDTYYINIAVQWYMSKNMWIP